MNGVVHYNLVTCIKRLNYQVEVMVTAQQVLSKANQIFNLNPRLGESLVDAAAKLKVILTLK